MEARGKEREGGREMVKAGMEADWEGNTLIKPDSLELLFRL